MRSRDDGLIVVVDTREQTPWTFPVPTLRAGLPSGDYSAVGLETVAAIERKSLADFVQSVTHERDRFWRELERLRPYRLRAVVVEASIDDILAGAYVSRATPQSVIASALAIMSDFGIPVLLAGDRGNASRAALWMLRRAWAKRAELTEQAGAIGEEAVHA